MKINPKSKGDVDDVNIMGVLNENYYNYEELGKQGKGRMLIPEPR